MPYPHNRFYFFKKTPFLALNFNFAVKYIETVFLKKRKGVKMSEISIKKLNEQMITDPQNAVAAAEKSYKDFVFDIAKRISGDDRIRVVLLAGPSGSGKTTSANLISDAVKAQGKESFVVSLDDFYRDAGDPLYPKQPSGERDYEAPGALDIPFLKETLSNIVALRPFSLPKYDFKVGGRVSVTKRDKMERGCVIIEGLHALNPIVYESLPKDSVYKIFISVSTNITSGGERLISGRKMRFIRRMVRDNLYRAASAERTLSMWENVLFGEDKYLYPFRNNADISFDTFHAFELAVMKPFALKLISDELAEKNDYAKTVKRALSASVSAPADIVPNDSLIREFIPGGIYESLY
jgi:uridine kinase